MFTKSSVKKLFIEIIILQWVVKVQAYKDEMANILSECNWNDTFFNKCLENALTKMAPYFDTGMPEFGVTPFDPLRLSFMDHRSSILIVNYHLKLKDIYQEGWKYSKFSHIQVDKENHQIEYHHYFPNITVTGNYELDVTSLIGISMKRSGQWKVKVKDYSQSTIVTRNSALVDGKLTYEGQPIKARVNVLKIGDVKMDISNILTEEGNFVESVVYSILTTWWRTAFPILHPHMNSIFSIGLTKVYDESFRDFPFNKVIPE